MPRADTGPNPLLDSVLPVYDVHERHEIRVRASAERTWDAVQALDFGQSRIVRAIFKGREWLMGSRRAQPGPPRAFLDEMRAIGWRPLRQEPGRLLVMGAVTQPWLPDVVFRGLSPEAFAAFGDPGFAKIAWTLEVEPRPADESCFRTQTRVATTDPASAARFRRYWRLVSPGIRLIRRQALQLVRRAAESRSDSAERGIRRFRG